MTRRATFPIALAALLCAGSAAYADTGATTDPDYRRVVERTTGMVGDERVRALAARHGLDVLDLTWEDTGRFLDSSVGPNISDMTIQVQTCEEQGGENCQLHLMPVIRHPNFEDETGDVPLDDFNILVGNEDGEGLRSVPLKDVLGDLRSYLHDPDSWAGQETSLLAPRDTHALVSAQAAFLPIPKGGEAQFNPVLFNYQSMPGAPAVLTILATREGTSVTVIDNERDGFAAGQTWGQRLFFNQDGERASLTGTRLSDSDAAPTDDTDGRQDGGDDAATDGLNMVLLVQVPLVYPERAYEADGAAGGDAVESAAMPAAPSDVENAVIGHGEVEGPFTEIDGYEIERDERFPIRVTVQFYKATATGDVSAADMDEIKTQIDRVYDEADYVGSLVVDDPSGRPTEHDGPKLETMEWWQAFEQRLTGGLGWSQDTLLGIWQRMRGA
jgi:hypothetical protein